MAVTGDQLAQTVARAGVARAGCCRSAFAPRSGFTQGTTPGSSGGMYVYRDPLNGVGVALPPEDDSEYSVVKN